jgi:hypothetical protein
VTRKSVGRDAPASEWEVVGSGFDDNGATGTVLFLSPKRSGIWLTLTLILDATESVTRFEVRQQYTERAGEIPIGTRLLRSVSLGHLAREGLKELRKRAERGTDPRFDPAGRESALTTSLALHSKPAGHKRPGRRGHPPDHYARLAVEYEAWQRTGERLAVLAKQKHMSESALRAALNAARSKGLLTKAPPGRAGGSATAKAKAVLRTAGAGDWKSREGEGAETLVVHGEPEDGGVEVVVGGQGVDPGGVE